jgi:hypothetical protein
MLARLLSGFGLLEQLGHFRIGRSLMIEMDYWWDRAGRYRELAHAERDLELRKKYRDAAAACDAMADDITRAWRAVVCRAGVQLSEKRR